MAIHRTLVWLALLALTLSFLGQGCASPRQTIESAIEELARSPDLTADFEATPCGLAGEAVTSATTSGAGLRATATLALRLEQECEQTGEPIPKPRGAPQATDSPATKPRPPNTDTPNVTNTTNPINDNKVDNHKEASHDHPPD